MKGKREIVMTIEKANRSLSPVHVHVDEATPIHVHVKKPTKGNKGCYAAVEDKIIAETKTASSFGASNLRRSTATAKARSRSPRRFASPPRSRSPGGDHWVPPPAKTTKGIKYSWRGTNHRLEVNQPPEKDTQTPNQASNSSMHRSDLSTDEEEVEQTRIRGYEKKIDCLMSEVGTLRGEMELQNVRSKMEEKENMLEASHRVLQRQEKELYDLQEELNASERENAHIRRRMDQLNDCDLDETMLTSDVLMKKLIEVEMEGQSTAQQVAALRDTVRRLKEDKQVSSSDSAVMAKQKELLMARFNEFEESNRSLRRLLRDRHQEETSKIRINEQRDILLRKLAEAEDSNQRLRNDMIDRDRLIKDLRLQASAQKEENLAIAGLQGSLESTRAHLQKQLRQKEGDCNRLAVQVRTLETQLAQEKIEVDHLSELLQSAKQKADHDKDALKKATRVQKDRAAKNADTVGQLRAQLLEKDNHIAEMQAEFANGKLWHEKATREKNQAVSEASALQMRVTELESIMHRVEDESKMQVEDSKLRLQEKSTESAAVKFDNERLRATLANLEETVRQSEIEGTQMRASLKEYERLVDEYRSQGRSSVVQQFHTTSITDHLMNRSRREADESITQLEKQKYESSRIVKDGEVEIEKVKTRLQSRLNELEPLPELLKTTEFRLQDANEKLLAYEKRNTENTKLIAELTSKVQHQSDQTDQLRDRYHRTSEESLRLQGRVEVLERKQNELEGSNKNLLSSIAKKEESLLQANLRLEERTHENQALARQLESALSDARRLTESSRDKMSTKERATQARIMDLEAQLSQSRTEMARLKREKEEAERKFNSRLYDLKDRLEQAHCTNRSMQNYVQFLKNSYANVFGESSSLPPSSTLPGTSTYPPF